METLKAPLQEISESNGFSQPPPTTREIMTQPLMVLEVGENFALNDSFEEIASNLKFQAIRIHSLYDLFSFLFCTRRDPAMIVLDQDTIMGATTGDSIPNTIRTLMESKAPDTAVPRLAVRITRPLEKNTVRNLKALGMQGLVPANGHFNFYLNLKAYEEMLLQNAEYWPTECVKKNTEPRRGQTQDACGIRLTERQQQVQKLLCERGLSNKAIARHLNISESTVKIHVSAILKRYAVRNRTQLALAVKNHSRL